MRVKYFVCAWYMLCKLTVRISSKHPHVQENNQQQQRTQEPRLIEGRVNRLLLAVNQSTDGTDSGADSSISVETTILIVIPIFVALYGSCCVIYCIAKFKKKLKRKIKRAKQRRKVDPSEGKPPRQNQTQPQTPISRDGEDTSVTCAHDGRSCTRIDGNSRAETRVSLNSGKTNDFNINSDCGEIKIINNSKNVLPLQKQYVLHVVSNEQPVVEDVNTVSHETYRVRDKSSVTRDWPDEGQNELNAARSESQVAKVNRSESVVIKDAFGSVDLGNLKNINEVDYKNINSNPEKSSSLKAKLLVRANDFLWGIMGVPWAKWYTNESKGDDNPVELDGNKLGNVPYKHTAESPASTNNTRRFNRNVSCENRENRVRCPQSNHKSFSVNRGRRQYLPQNNDDSCNGDINQNNEGNSSEEDNSVLSTENHNVILSYIETHLNMLESELQGYPEYFIGGRPFSKEELQRSGLDVTTCVGTRLRAFNVYKSVLNIRRDILINEQKTSGLKYSVDEYLSDADIHHFINRHFIASNLVPVNRRVRDNPMRIPDTNKRTSHRPDLKKSKGENSCKIPKRKRPKGILTA